MYKSSIFCIALSRGRAGRLVLNLKEAGFSNAEISALFLDQTSEGVRIASAEAPASQEESGAQPAAVIGGVMAWIAAGGFLLIPGACPIVAAGPIAAALGDETVKGVADGLTDLGVPLESAWRYERRVKSGHVLISVSTENSDLGERARSTFAAAGAEDICTTKEVAWTS